MSRRIALPLLASGLALVTLAATVIPFQGDALRMAARAPWERIAALLPLVGVTIGLGLVAALACWRAPRHPGSLVLLALALGSLGGTTTLLAIPGLLDASPAHLAVTTG